jgi:chromosome segregation ATPase
LRRERLQTASSTPTDNAIAERASEKARLGSDLQALSTQLESEAQKLNSLRSRLDNLKQQLSSKVDPNYGYQISNLSDEIQDLSSTLREYQWSESDLDRQLNLALQQQSAALRISVQQMEQNILKQEQEIKVNQDELSYWIYNNNDITQKDERVQYLEEALLNQSQALNDMKTQRAEILTRSMEQSQNIQAQAREVASAINEDRYDIQEQMSSLRGEIKRLQYLQNQSRTSQFSLTAQV